MRLRQIFAENLRRARRRKDLSQEALADLAAIDRTYVSALERQVYSASLDTIEKLADVLNIEPADLLATPGNH
jgi:transcriptional regulator with XRE-family HTH domain